jgi:hypothetical protein
MMAHGDHPPNDVISPRRGSKKINGRSGMGVPVQSLRDRWHG